MSEWEDSNLALHYSVAVHHRFRGSDVDQMVIAKLSDSTIPVKNPRRLLENLFLVIALALIIVHFVHFVNKIMLKL